MKLGFLNIFCIAAPLFCGAAEAMLHAEMGQGAVCRENNTAKKPKKRAPERQYINIDLLHENLPGSHLHDDTCLVFSAAGCSVWVLADEDEQVRFIYIRANTEEKNKNRRREAVDKVKSSLRLALDQPERAHELRAEDDAAVLLFFDPLDEYDEDHFYGVSRCDAVQTLLCLYSSEEIRPVLGKGFAWDFYVELGGVLARISLDMSSPGVDYIENRVVKVLEKKMSVNPEELVRTLYPDLNAKPEKKYRTFGSGGSNMRTLATDGVYYLARNAKFYALGTPEKIREASERNASYKQSGFAAADFSRYEVKLPLSCKGKELIDDAEEEDEGEQTPATLPALQPDVAPGNAEPPVQPQQPAEQPQQPAVQTPEPPQDAQLPPLSPADALEAYKKILREM